MSANIKTQTQILKASELEKGMMIIHNNEPSLVINSYKDLQEDAYRVELVKMNSSNDEQLEGYDFNQQIKIKDLFIEDDDQKNSFIFVGFSNLYSNYVENESMLFHYALKSSVIDEITKEMWDMSSKEYPEYLI